MRTAEQAESTVMVTMPFRVSSVHGVRAQVVSFLRRARIDRATIDDAAIVVSELLANSLKHASPLTSGQLIVTLAVDPALVEIAVTDGGSPSQRPRVEHAGTTAVGGRGLAMVEALSRRWWVSHDADSTTITAELARNHAR